jgi:hypothetical protein
MIMDNGELIWNNVFDGCWVNVFDYLDAKEIGRCTTMSVHINKCAQQHFKQIRTVVQVVQRRAWGKVRLARWELPSMGSKVKMVSSISAEKNHFHSYTE